MTVNESSVVKKHNNKWRVVDIVVAAIIAVAAGVIFWGWDVICAAPITLFEAVTPGFEGLLNGIWLFAGPLAAIIVRKPGAALFAETLAAALELAMGNPWGIGGSLIIGICQALLPKSVLRFLHTNVGICCRPPSLELAGLGCFLYNWTVNPAWAGLRIVVSCVTSVISGALVAGVLMYLLQQAIAKTGVLDRFESGRAKAWYDDSLMKSRIAFTVVDTGLL